MIFFWLALIALSFGLFGFLLHDFYFSRQQLIRSMRKELDDLNQALASSNKETSAAQKQISKATMLIRSLEQQMEQSNKEISTLKQATRRQEETIRLLQRIGAEIRSTAFQTETRRSDIETVRSASRPHDSLVDGISAISEANRDSQGRENAKSEEGKGLKIPLWKENLNNILSMLDEIEKETSR